MSHGSFEGEQYNHCVDDREGYTQEMIGHHYMML